MRYLRSKAKVQHWQSVRIRRLLLCCLVSGLTFALAIQLLNRFGVQPSPVALAADIPPALIVNNEGGPVSIRGQVSYSYAFFTTGVAAPMVILEDQAGFIDRNENFIFPVESQTLGQITSDFYTSPFSYTISLPVEPQATRRDVDNDDDEDIGVMVFAVAYWTNTFGDPFLEQRDLFGGGWSTAYASTRVSSDVSTRREIVGGTFLVYAPDDQQGFPSGFGADGLIFTEDDPIVRIPQGYTLVHMDSPTFTFDRARYPQLNLIEPESSVTEDFSSLPYDLAFDEMLDKLRREYAFTELKAVDWDALNAEFRPRFAEAEEEDDSRAYLRALRDFVISIPDGHFSGPFLSNEFRRATAGGLGMAVRELADGRVVVNFLTEDGPAAKAGIQLQAEITHIDNTPIQEALNDVMPWSAPFSTTHVERLQQLRYIVRLPLGESRMISYRNPGMPNPRAVSLQAIAEQESFQFSSLRRGLTGYELPLEYRVLPSGFVYAKIYRFSDNELLTIQLWERLLSTLNSNDAPGLIIDMRQNSGGSGFLADQMAAYFFNQEYELGNAGRYNDETGDFYFDDRSIDRYYLPAENLRYLGDVAVLIGPNCNSACEFFSYNLTIENRAVIVGQYPTAGLGGSIDVFIMPEQERIQFTAGRAVDMDGEIHIEGQGVLPHVQVPVNLKTLFGSEDPILDAAIAYLQNKDIEVVEGGRILIGEEVSGFLESNQRSQYTLPIAANERVTVSLQGASEAADTILRVYGKDGSLIRANDDAPVANGRYSVLSDLRSEKSTTWVIEVASFGNELRGNYTLRVDRQVTTDTELLTEGNGAQVVSPPSVPQDADTPTATELNEQAEEKAPDVFGEAKVITQGARLRVRAGPTTQAEVVGYVGLGWTLDVVEISRDGGWVRLLIDSLDQGDSGWVDIDYLDIKIFDE